MRITTILFSLPLLFACTGNKDETVDLEEIMPISNFDKEEKKDSIPQEKVFQPSLDLKEVELAGITWDSIATNEVLTVPERFNPTRIEKFTYYTGGSAVNFNSWSFKDSIKSFKTFLNWMNCYGDRCSMIELRVPVNMQRNALLIMQADTCIIQVQTTIVGINELKKWKKFYTSIKNVKWNYIILQPKGGKSSWTAYRDDKEIELNPNEN